MEAGDNCTAKMEHRNLGPKIKEQIPARGSYISEPPQCWNIFNLCIPAPLSSSELRTFFNDLVDLARIVAFGKSR